MQLDQNKNKGTEDVLLVLCNSIAKIMQVTTQSDISFSPMIQKITQTCLKPDIGCFVLFEGGFSGLVIINFSKEAAIEIYQKYMMNMGMPKEELANIHTSDDVGDILAELTNQIVGDFQVTLENQLQVSVNQSQPKMLAINNELIISINTRIDEPESRKVAFQTSNRNRFYLEMSMEKTEFIQMLPFDNEKPNDLDTILENNRHTPPTTESKSDDVADDDFLNELGI